MASKLFLISLIISQAKLTNENMNFLGPANLLNQASEDQKNNFFKTSFDHADANKDGFVTSDELDFETSTLPFAFLISGAITEAMIQFEHENEIDPTKIGITFQDYKDALKRKLEQIYGKIAE